MKRTIAILVTTLLFAGCINQPTDVDPLDTQPTALPYLGITDTHDHKDPGEHRVAWNMEQTAWDPVAPDVTKLGRYNHVVVHGTTAYVTAYQLEKDGQPGLAIFNISGPEPVLTATLATPEITPIDVHVSEDGKYAVLAGHRDNRATLPSDAQACTGTPMLDACTPYVPGGVILVDVSDEAAPAIVDTYHSFPSGGHTAKIVQYDSGYHVFIASYGFSYASRAVSGVEVLMLTDTPLGDKLQPVARYLPSTPSGNDGDTRRFVHDIWIEDHPNGDLLMYVSYWDGGVVIVDVNDPHQPQEIADWNDFDTSLYGNIHFARPVGEIDGKHITYAAPEFGSAEHSGEAYVLDTTDPADPQLIATWTLPGDPVSDGFYRFSPHNFDPLGTQIVYAHYHGGIWVLDLADPAEPVVKGYAFPVVPAGTPEYEHREDAPLVWAAVWGEDGTIWASDIGTGLHQYRMVEEEPGAPPFLGQLANE